MNSENSSTKVPRDDGLEWLRDIRRQMAAEANYDAVEMGRRLREIEREMQDRLVTTERVVVPAKPDKAA
jgi:hypothetical protein